MKIQIELNVKCRNCEHWECVTEDDIDFLDDDETYCKLDNKKRKETEECEKIEISFNKLKRDLNVVGYRECVVL